jgi:hypothetical protein
MIDPCDGCRLWQCSAISLYLAMLGHIAQHIDGTAMGNTTLQNTGDMDTVLNVKAEKHSRPPRHARGASEVIVSI